MFCLNTGTCTCVHTAKQIISVKLCSTTPRMGTKHIHVHLAMTKCTDPPGDAAVSPYALQKLFYPFQASILNIKQKKMLQILQRPSLAVSPWQIFVQVLHPGGGEAVAE